MAESKKKQNISDLVDGGVRPPCCYNCFYLSCDTGRMGQPHLEIWCRKDLWWGGVDKKTLLLETECTFHKRED